MNGTLNVKKIEVYSRDEKPLGKSWEELAARWWQWCYETEIRYSNPCQDSTGECCDKHQIESDIWFLAGTFGGKAERKCLIPFGKSIFFPIINDLISFEEYHNLKTEKELEEYAKADLDTTSIIDATVDNFSLQNLRDYRVRTHMFEMNYPLEDYDNIRGTKSSTPRRAISDGYWVCLKPLASGNHIVHFMGEKLAFDEVYNKDNLGNEPKFSVEVTYNLTVLS